MQLLGPTTIGIEVTEEEHHKPGELVQLLRRGRGAGTRDSEDRLRLSLGAIGVRNIFHAVVGDAGAERMEKVVAILERSEKRGEVADVDIGASAELVDPSVETNRIVYPKRFVWAEGRVNLGLELGFLDRDMMREIVDRVIGRADHVDAVLRQDAVGRHLWRAQLGVGSFPDFWRCFLVDDFVDAEIAAKFEMRPVVERIANRLRNGLRPGEELVVIARLAACDQILGHAVRTHRAPLVVIAREPDLEEILELAVVRNLVRRQMAVIVKDRLLDRVLKVERPRPFSAKEEIFGEEGFGGRHKANKLKHALSGHEPVFA